jgi:hypothetical protein
MTLWTLCGSISPYSPESEVLVNLYYVRFDSNRGPVIVHVIAVNVEDALARAYEACRINEVAVTKHVCTVPCPFGYDISPIGMVVNPIS